MSSFAPIIYTRTKYSDYNLVLPASLQDKDVKKEVFSYIKDAVNNSEAAGHPRWILIKNTRYYLLGATLLSTEFFLEKADMAFMSRDNSGRGYCLFVGYLRQGVSADIILDIGMDSRVFLPAVECIKGYWESKSYKPPESHNMINLPTKMHKMKGSGSSVTHNLLQDDEINDKSEIVKVFPLNYKHDVWRKAVEHPKSTSLCTNFPSKSNNSFIKSKFANIVASVDDIRVLPRKNVRMRNSAISDVDLDGDSDGDRDTDPVTQNLREELKSLDDVDEFVEKKLGGMLKRHEERRISTESLEKNSVPNLSVSVSAAEDERITKALFNGANLECRWGVCASTLTYVKGVAMNDANQDDTNSNNFQVRELEDYGIYVEISKDKRVVKISETTMQKLMNIIEIIIKDTDK